MISFNIHSHNSTPTTTEKLAGTELGQAQLQLELGFYIDDYKLPLHITEHNMSVNLVTSTYLHTSLLNC